MASTTTTTVTETYDKVITYEPPPVKVQTIYAPHTIHTFYNSHRVPRMHTVYKSVSPDRIHTVISTPRLHTIHTSPARVETSIVKVTPSPKPIATTTTTTTKVTPSKDVTRVYYPLVSRFYDDRVIDIQVERSVPLRSKSTVSVVRNSDFVENLVSNKYEYEYKEVLERKNSKSLADLTIEEKVTVKPVESPAEAPAPAPASEAAPEPVAETKTVQETKVEDNKATTTTTTTTTTTLPAGLRPSKSFNGLNTLTYNSYVYDLNHGFDENHKNVTVLKETTTTTEETSVPATVVVPFACRSREFFVGEMKNFTVNNDGIRWYGAPSQYNLRYWY